MKTEEPSLVIRRARGSDWEKGFKTSLSALSPCYLNAKEYQDILADRSGKGIQTFVALLGDTVVGTASLIIERKLSRHGNKVGHIEDVSVDTSFQGKGVGAKLVEHLITVCKGVGAVKIILDCSSELTSFYQKFGFKQFGVAMRLDLI